MMGAIVRKKITLYKGGILLVSIKRILPLGLILIVIALGITYWYHVQEEEESVTINRGINIGNALEAPRDIPWDVTMDVAFFDEIVAVGFDTVRLPVRFSDYVGAAPEYTLDEAFMEELDGYIDYALDLGLVLILDCHHFETLMGAPEEYEETLYAIWTQLGQRYEKYPKELVFELLNEPTNQLTPNLWNEMLANTLDCVRQNNPTRLVIIDAPLWGSIEGLYQLELPEDENLLASFHYYVPMEFTFQGNEYHPEYAAYHDVPWMGTEEEMATLLAVFQGAYDWAERQGVGIFLGEFGSNHYAPTDSRIRWTKAVIETAEQFGFGWCYWELASQFGIYDADTQLWDTEMLDIMLS